MSKYVTAGSASVHHVDFLVGGELVVPTSASYTLTKNDGTALQTNSPLTVTSTTTGVDITISSGNNTVSLPNEVRYLSVKFVYGGTTYTIDQYYLLRSNTRFPLSPDDVRAVLGLQSSELDDSNIDILRAYDLVQSDVEDVDLAAVLSGGTALLPTLIEAVKIKAAMVSTVGIEASMFQMEQADNTLYKRFASVDFNAIRGDLSGRYSQLLALLADEDTTAGAVTISQLAFGTDPVTGT